MVDSKHWRKLNANAKNWMLAIRRPQSKQEQLGILTRLAAAAIVSSQDGVPLILDDALGFSDHGRLETMGAAIAATG